MKSILFAILLLLPSLSISQSTDLAVNKALRDSIYTGLKQNDQLKTKNAELQKAVNDLYAIIESQADSIKHIFADISKINTAIKSKNDELANKEVEIQKVKSQKTKTFGIGLQVGYDPFSKKPYGGGGISWNPFGF